MNERRPRLSSVLRFNIIGAIGIVLVILLGGLIYTLSGWSQWVSYGIPSIALILVMLAITPALRRSISSQQNERQQGTIDS
ncbi:MULTISPECIES: hypothetical protein [Arthrobacter]|uniref:Uncharacterized protein n=1 Tax=Arthrobacter terricola TaxID=2547396 RepID=A0A4R5KDW3_9MICC|nr:MULTISPECIES: hypothetical protein [Arthrobacter]MBT8162615.1 hypothetical protein [Arthrobacter sp. GN70]TDF92397.1 hypothetical protein E1809_17800 [Arthrobacter terricola]